MDKSKSDDMAVECDVCGHPQATGNVIYESSGRRTICPSCNPTEPIDSNAEVAFLRAKLETARALLSESNGWLGALLPVYSINGSFELADELKDFIRRIRQTLAEAGGWQVVGEDWPRLNR